MSLDEEINESDKIILRRVNELSREIVLEEYKPIFDKVRTIAVVHMNQLGINELTLNNRMHFRKDGNFYVFDTPTGQHKSVRLEELPDYSRTTRDNEEAKPGFTEYHTTTNNLLDNFRETVKNSIAQSV